MKDALSKMPLLAQRLWADVRVLASVRSTNDYAVGAIQNRTLQLPAVVAASRQTAGRGQASNRWFSDSGSLAVTFALPAQTRHPAHQLPLRAAVALFHAISHYIDPGLLSIKWPNDLLANRRKLAGILCRRVDGADIIGIGINVHTNFANADTDVQRRAISIAQLTPTAPTRQDVLRDVAAEMAKLWDRRDWWDQINRVLAMRDQWTRVQRGDETTSGICRGIDAQGRLLLQADHGTKAILTGHVLP